MACLPNGLAMFPFVKGDAPPGQGGVYGLPGLRRIQPGDFLAFNVNFQPNLLVPVFVGQICGGIIGILFLQSSWRFRRCGRWSRRRQCETRPGWPAPRVVVLHLG